MNVPHPYHWNVLQAPAGILSAWQWVVYRVWDGCQPVTSLKRARCALIKINGRQTTLVVDTLFLFSLVFDS